MNERKNMFAFDTTKKEKCIYIVCYESLLGDVCGGVVASKLVGFSR